MRFLFTRRWVLFGLTVAVLAWLATQLGQWQFGRLDDRRELNHLVAANLDQAPAPVAELLTVGQDPDKGHEWRKVVVHGRWDDRHTIELKYQTRDGGPGIDVVTPLVTCLAVDQRGNADPADDACTEPGPAVLVDRGWMKTDNSGGGQRPVMPAATQGGVTVVGWIRRNATGSAAEVNDLSTRAISSSTASKVLTKDAVGYDLYGGFLDLESELPAPATALAAVELPDDTSEGPHFFYGLQWWFFAALAVFGFGYLAYDERRQAQRTRASESAEHPTVDGEHHSGDEG